MSASEFSNTIKKKIEELYNSEKLNIGELKNANRLSIFKRYDSTKKLRSAYNSAESGQTSVITEQNLKALTEALVINSTNKSLKELSTKLFNSIDLNNFATKWAPAHGVPLEVNPDGGYIANRVPITKLKEVFMDYLWNQAEISGVSTPVLMEYIESNIQNGHLAGVFSFKTALALGVKVDYSESATSYRDFTVTLSGTKDTTTTDYTNTIDSILKLLLDADFITSNLTNNIEIFNTATKSVLGTDSPYLTSELQFGKDNEDAGGLLKRAGDSLKKIIKSFPKAGTASLDAPNLDKQFKKFIENLIPVADLLISKSEAMNTMPLPADLKTAVLGNAAAIKKLGLKLAKTPGSPSIIDSISENALSVLKTGKTKAKITTRVSLKQKSQLPDTQAKEINKLLKIAQDNLKKSKAALESEAKKASKATSIKLKAVNDVKTFSLTSVKMLLDQQITKQIEMNMGTGARKDVLNLRTGRFAQSVKIDHLSLSKQGLITAFYTYMRNPYGTFSKGGRQEHPTTRDPKLLISKSIHEIASTLVSNRLRAVLA